MTGRKKGGNEGLYRDKISWLFSYVKGGDEGLYRDKMSWLFS